MDIRDHRGLKAQARAALADASCDPGRLALLHAGVTAAVLLALALVDLLLQRQISNTGGLGGMGARSVLSTVQTLLESGQGLLLPFWNMGYIFAILAIFRREPCGAATLLEGFRKFGPVLRLLLCQVLIYAVLAFVCLYPSAMLFMMTPLARPILSVMTSMDPEALMQDPTILMEDPAAASALAYMYLVFFAVYLLVCIPIFYRFRMAEFALASDPKAGAIAAMRNSFRMMRKNRLALFRLDLSFWWFYALELLSAALCYGDVLLEALGVTLPFAPWVAYLLFYLLGLAVQTVLYWQARNMVTTTYAAAYHALLRPAAPKPTPVPQNQPWSY